MDTIKLISQFGSCPEIFEGVDTSAGASRGRPLGAIAWFQMVGIIDSLDKELAAVNDDKELSKDGKAKRKARLCRDAEARLAEANAHLERLKKDVEEIDIPLTQIDQSVTAAIWPRLPEDQLEVRMLHTEALEAGDFATCAAIENLPVAFPGRQTPDDLAVLKRDRMRVEAPDKMAALEMAEDVYAVVAATAQSTVGWLADESRGLPAPDQKEEVTKDGMLFLSPSQLAEARA